MSRVGCCADNGLMEGFWGMLKRERYYTRKFTSRKAVVSMINGYIYFYNNKRIQRKLHLLAPMEVFNIQRSSNGCMIKIKVRLDFL